MITPINIALLGVLVLAAVALLVSRRRRSGATDEAAHADADAAQTVSEEPDWAEAAATLAPVREDEAEVATDVDLDDDGGEVDEDLDAGHEAEDEDLDGPGGEQDQDTGEIEGLGDPSEPEAASGPDDGLGDIITEPGWYLPGETDMTRGSPGGEAGLLVPETEIMIPGEELEDEQAAAAIAPSAPLLGEGADGFDATAGWAAPAEDDEQPAGPSWLGLGGEEDPAPDPPIEDETGFEDETAFEGEITFEDETAFEDEIAFEDTPTPSDHLFGLPELAEGIPEEEHHDLDAPSFPLDRWEDPVTPAPSFALGGAPADLTVARHGPLTVSVDPAAFLAIVTEGIERSTSREGDVSWELTLKVELRQRGDIPGTTAD